MTKLRSTVLLPALLAVALASDLPRVSINTSSISTSGISSGAFFASQMHVIYSDLFVGVGMIAGGPYYCAQANEAIALSQCMQLGGLINIPYLVGITKNTASFGFAAPVANMKSARVWVFSGLNDTVVSTDVVQAAERFYEAFVEDPASQIKAVYDQEGEHSQITNFYGNSCTKLGEPYINNCKYDAAGELLQHIYSNTLEAPSSQSVSGTLYSFDQAQHSKFLGGALWSLTFGLGQTGYVYVPKQCDNAEKTCNLHVAFHGCEMTLDDIGELYVKYGGYNSWADANDFVVLYPQAVANLLNPKGCWDWWGYAGVDYASNLGVQTSTVKRIIDALVI